jgi:hypothetical protein
MTIDFEALCVECALSQGVLRGEDMAVEVQRSRL